MDWSQTDLKGKIREIAKQVGYVRLILLALCGIFLIYVSLPEREEAGILTEEDESYDLSGDDNDIYVEKMEKRLARILELIEGAGKVEVMITLSSSTETVVDKDSTYEESSEKEDGDDIKESQSSVRKEETVMVDEDGDQLPYVIKTLEPIVEGVIEVMEGGGNPTVAAEVTEAVQALFHVEAHKIKVLKMEGGS